MKSKRSISIILSLALVLASIFAIDVFAERQQKLKTYLFSRDRVMDLLCLQKDDVPVPFVAIDDYLNKVCQTYYSSEKLSDGTYRISNKYGEMTVDPEKDTLTFDAFEQFLYYDGRVDPDDTSVAKYEYVDKINYVGDPKPLIMDLSAYNIDVMEEDGKVYLPLTTICDIASITYCSAVYYDNEISFNYSLQKPFVNWRNSLNDLKRKDEEVSFTFNELCFVMDYLYACPSRCELSEEIASKGFDRTLQDHGEETRLVREYLLSSDASRFAMGLALMSLMLYDGGHTNFDHILDNSATPVIQGFNNILSDNTDPGTVLYNKWKEKKLQKIAEANKIKNYLDGYNRYGSVKVFDESSSDGGDRFRYYEYDDTGIFVYNDYDEETVEHFKKALDLAKAHGMKNFVLDESSNYGGYVESAMYMICAMTGENKYYLEGPKVGNIIEFTDKFDMDLDGIYEGKKEDFDYGFNFGVICSAGSFSAGSNVPCIAQEYGIPILGQTSGGGGCYFGEFKMTMGNLYNISSFATLKTKDGKSIEAGATPDYELEYDQIHDFALIDRTMDEHYATHTVTKKTEAEKEAPDVGEK